MEIAKNKTVLVVEDDFAIRSNLRLLLSAAGYAVQQAKNGQEALNIMQTQHELPTLVLLDIMMPVMDGWQFRKHQIKDQRLAAIPVIVMTADGHAEQKSLELEAQGYVRKPIDIDSFLDLVAKF